MPGFDPRLISPPTRVEFDEENGTWFVEDDGCCYSFHTREEAERMLLDIQRIHWEQVAEANAKDLNDL
ncbi:hypothetical protein C7476_101343 [Phyllobacterium bourgognense]|uniref:Uncharacterized protein n=1 Tax=Phyllobacterium bourgognense TaxID=314236 RepID=A0A368Z8U9_9HYPH|nr:hypothetical protein C7476_101343 [Phyllobacterium bourgognense]